MPRGRPQTKPHLMSHHEIPTEILGYSVWLATWDDGTLTIGVGGAKRRQQAILNSDQTHELTRTLQSLQTEL